MPAKARTSDEVVALLAQVIERRARELANEMLAEALRSLLADRPSPKRRPNGR